MARTHSESTNINPVRSSILPGGKKNQTFVRPDDDDGDGDDDDDDDDRREMSRFSEMSIANH